ncbi:VOC family protein [Klebsiella variicola]|uniref:VOC family protein n=1 Tax=Klebsiella TaxID=570 RepID=UPI0005434FF1|nr:VOC family protein [Klebsiella variicola]HBS2507153.1 glyoxalase/bleomycin resistance/dioxygenase family protein [Klebsiella variicola subsp. variicola]EIY5088790.1 glyoxalase/bleomycin resistance/dioxygenase family protein [Klebsiella variicola]ELA2923398.1 glyoxalase/bleomycin resistance/dioxygenase family protein [Klebsiella variicola]KHE25022.1 glyoxalase [Klebsiella variicola]MBC5377879.1 glyoxalase/bleomycin resistance/dioxygenase family protein [Klebsiella variicola]
MSHDFADIDVLFIAGFGPITRSTSQSRDFYYQALGLPLKPMPGNEAYLLSEQDAIGGVKHFALWPLAQAAQSCFGQEQWPETEPVPQAWIEFEVRDLTAATARLQQQGYRLLVAARDEPWGQTVTRLLSPEGLLAGLTVTPWLRAEEP